MATACTEMFGHVDFDICKRTDRKTDTDELIAILCTPPREQFRVPFL